MNTNISFTIGLPTGVPEQHRMAWLHEEASQLGHELAVRWYNALIVGVAFGPKSFDHYGNAEPAWVNDARAKVEPAVRAALGL